MCWRSTHWLSSLITQLSNGNNWWYLLVFWVIGCVFWLMSPLTIYISQEPSCCVPACNISGDLGARQSFNENSIVLSAWPLFTLKHLQRFPEGDQSNHSLPPVTFGAIKCNTQGKLGHFLQHYFLGRPASSGFRKQHVRGQHFGQCRTELSVCLCSPRSRQVCSISAAE